MYTDVSRCIIVVFGDLLPPEQPRFCIRNQRSNARGRAYCKSEQLNLKIARIKFCARCARELKTTSIRKSWNRKTRNKNFKSTIEVLQQGRNSRTRIATYVEFYEYFVRLETITRNTTYVYVYVHTIGVLSANHRNNRAIVRN